MGVLIVPITREMLQGTRYAFLFHSLHHGGNSRGAVPGREPQATLIDKVAGVRGHVAYRGKVQVDPRIQQQPGLGSGILNKARQPAAAVDISGGVKGLWRKLRVAADPDNRAALLVSSQEHGGL